MKKEIWKPVVGYEGLYEVSNLGRVKSVKFGRERVLKPIKHPNGYLCVNLCKDGKRKNCLVHRLVAQAFIPNPLNLPEINHINEQKTENRASNLQWCDRQYNCNYGTRNTKVAKALLNHPSKSKPVLQYTLKGELIREWPSTMEAERQGGFDNRRISFCCNGKRKKHGGYVWKFKEAV